MNFIKGKKYKWVHKSQPEMLASHYEYIDKWTHDSTVGIFRCISEIKVEGGVLLYCKDYNILICYEYLKPVEQKSHLPEWMK